LLNLTESGNKGLEGLEKKTTRHLGQDLCGKFSIVEESFYAHVQLLCDFCFGEDGASLQKFIAGFALGAGNPIFWVCLSLENSAAHEFCAGPFFPLLSFSFAIFLYR